MKKKNDYVKAKRVSERLTGKPLAVRYTSKKFKSVIKQCNDAVEQILTKSELTEEQQKQAKKIGL